MTTVDWIGATLERLELCESAAAIDADTGLYGKGIGLDSIEVLQIVAAIEEHYDTTLEDDELEPRHFQTVGALARFIEERAR